MTEKKKADEATRKRLEDARLKGLETRRMKAALKKTEKEESKEALRKAYEEKVLKKKQEPPAQPVSIEETDKEVYPKARVAEETEDESEESETEELPLRKPTKQTKTKTKAKKQTQMITEPTIEPNWKQEYYRTKLEKIRQQDDDKNFMQSYQRMPSSVHVADVARQQLNTKINKELFDRIYNDMYGGL